MGNYTSPFRQLYQLSGHQALDTLISTWFGFIILKNTMKKKKYSPR